MSRVGQDNVERGAKSELERRLAKLEAELARVSKERDILRRAYEDLVAKHKLLERRIYIAKAERIDATQLEIEFAETTAKLDAVRDSLGTDAGESAPDADGDAGNEKARPRNAGKPGGRKKLTDLDLPEERVEITDPALEGTCERIGFEESYRLGYRRASRTRIVVAVAQYKRAGDSGATEFLSAERPKEIVRRGLLAPTMIAHILVAKYLMGIPFFRLEEQCGREGVPLDRSTMCRYAEDVGAALGTIVLASRDEAMKTAFCLSTDATGVSIQPTPLPEKARQACRKGHFFVVLADRDHIFFEYQAKHTSDAVCEMFRGFSGFIQADAHAIYNALYRGEANAGCDPPCAAPTEVGCWSHTRTKFWEAAMSKHPIGGPGLLRIRRMFETDAAWLDEPPKRKGELRRSKLAPLVDEFFDWVRGEYALVKDERGVASTALGYAHRQEAALRAFLADGRLRMENNASERELRRIAIGRKAWLFCGSDDHASAAANLFSLIASCKLHGLDPERYLAEVIRVHPQWPLHRHLELSPRYWARTRERLVPAELANELGPITVPDAAVATSSPAA